MPLVKRLLEKHKIKSAFLFGSAVTNRFNETSDVDLLVSFQEELEPLEKGEQLMDLQIALEDSLKRAVDILIETSLKNKYLIEEINEKKVKIYE